jgi:hypothetical protein
VQIEFLSEFEQIEVIAINRSVRDLRRLNRCYGRGRWRKMKGFARVRLPDGSIIRAEIHWYGVHGIGKREIKIKGPAAEQ